MPNTLVIPNLKSVFAQRADIFSVFFFLENVRENI